MPGVPVAGPPKRSSGLLADVWNFLILRPAIGTLVRFQSEDHAEGYRHRIAQRIGVSVAGYSVLNLHRIGINAPVSFVFEELLTWDGDSTCWPNHIATVERVGGGLEQIRMRWFGHGTDMMGLAARLFGSRVPPLFDLDARHIQRMPDPFFDNARYLLYDCSGGYPIGVFSIYVRSPIAAEGEVEPTQLFALVGFDFYGRKRPLYLRGVRLPWQALHNRAMGNVMNRFKLLCEWRFQTMVAGPGKPAAPPAP